MRKLALIGAALVAASALAGCTSQQEQAVTSAIQSECAALPAQTTLGIQIASGTTVVSSQSATITQLESAACPIVAAAASSAIDAVTAAGGTATVTVTTQGAGGTALRRGVMRVTSQSMYVVQPGGIFDGLKLPFGL